MLFEQKQFLEHAGELSEQTPWVAFMITRKTEILLESGHFSEEHFESLADKEYHRLIQNKLSEVCPKARLDDDTAQHVNELLALQIASPKLEKIHEVAQHAMALGVEDLSSHTMPVEDPPGHGCIAMFIIASALFWWITSIDPEAVLLGAAIAVLMVSVSVWEDARRQKKYAITVGPIVEANKLKQSFAQEIGGLSPEIAHGIPSAPDSIIDSIVNFQERTKQLLEAYLVPYISRT